MQFRQNWAPGKPLVPHTCPSFPDGLAQPQLDSLQVLGHHRRTLDRVGTRPSDSGRPTVAKTSGDLHRTHRTRETRVGTRDTHRVRRARRTGPGQAPSSGKRCAGGNARPEGGGALRVHRDGTNGRTDNRSRRRSATGRRGTQTLDGERVRGWCGHRCRRAPGTLQDRGLRSPRLRFNRSRLLRAISSSGSRDRARSKLRSASSGRPR